MCVQRYTNKIHVASGLAADLSRSGEGSRGEGSRGEGSRKEPLSPGASKKLSGVLLSLFWVFFKIGMFTFGGGLEMLPLFKKELVEKHKWIDCDTLLDIISISQSIPGSLTVNSAAFLGRAVAGIPGALVAITGAVAAPLLCISVVIVIQPLIWGNVYVDRFFAGVRAAVVGLILSALLELRRHVIRGAADFVVVTAAFIMMEVFKVHFIYIIAVGVLCSLFLYFLSHQKKLACVVVLALNIAVSLINYKVFYLFWAVFVLAYVSYRYEIHKRKTGSNNDTELNDTEDILNEIGTEPDGNIESNGNEVIPKEEACAAEIGKKDLHV